MLATFVSCGELLFFFTVKMVVVLLQQVHMMMHLLIRDQNDGILCPIPSHSLYTSYMVLQGATLVCTAVTRNRKKKATAVTNYYAIPIFL